MYSNSNGIKKFTEQKAESNDKLMLYKKGSLYPDNLPPMPVVLRFPYNGIWSLPWTEPDKSVHAGNATGTLDRFRTPKTLREMGKERNLFRLAIFPDYHTKEIPEYSGKSEFGVQQLPIAYPELAGFNDVPIGAAAATNSNSSDAARSIWGFLESGLKFFTGLEQAKYQTQIAEAQAKLIQAQTAQKASITSASLVSNLSLLLILGGVGFVLISSLTKKGGK
ncbi:MAG: hypothetical protein ABIG95_02450 [Candidatus Woesearchaeota archaeon]